MTDRTIQISPGSLTRARHLRGLTKRELASKVGVGEDSVGAWEQTGRLRARNLDTLSRVLGFPSSFFTAGHTMDVTPCHFRLLLNDTAQKHLDRADSYAYLVGDLLGALQSSIGLPHVSLSDRPVDPAAGAEAMITTARAVRDELGLGGEPIANATWTVERAGVAVVFSPAYSRGIDAYSRWIAGRPIIVQAATDPARLRFDLLHELGHLIMHRHVALSGDRAAKVARVAAQEAQAHRFAGEMLFPPTQSARTELAHAVATRYWSRMFELKAKWGVSVQALLRRAEELSLMSPEDRRTRMEEVGRRGWRRNEPGRMAFPEIPALVANAIRDLRGIYPDADERLRKSYGIPEDLLTQITSRSPSRDISPV